MREVHMVYTQEVDDSLTLGSPQVPGLVAGFDTMEEGLDKESDLLEWVGVSVGQIYHHIQVPVQSAAGVEYLVRAYHPVDDARRETAEKIVAKIVEGITDTELARNPPMVTGERLLIAVLPTDTIGWCLDQLGTGQGATIEMLSDGSDVMYCMPLVEPGSSQESGTLEEWGLRRESSVAECFDTQLIAEMKKLGLQAISIAA